jgi:hypothetical protein
MGNFHASDTGTRQQNHWFVGLIQQCGDGRHPHAQLIGWNYAAHNVCKI